MDLYESVLKPLLFQVDPEKAHDMGMVAIRSGALKVETVQDACLETQCFGVRFVNPIGLAAGFDKNALAVDQWDDLGFGFAELGTVTALAQPGNPKPRLFRYPADAAIINRMGFNNDGSAAVASRLAEASPTIPIGINLGKSKATPLDQAAGDYAQSYARLAEHADYVVINVSSPNTPGLRQLQAAKELETIVQAIQASGPPKPLFVKISPDLNESDMEDILQLAADVSLTGLIATNTTLSRNGLSVPTGEAGGLSGRPLKLRSEAVLQFLAQRAPKDLVLISVGGIETAEDIRERLLLGAHLVQVYSGWVYGGPGWIPKTLRRLVELADRDGIRNVAEWRLQAARDA